MLFKNIIYLVLTGFLAVSLFGEEEMIIGTYYPAPMGLYNNLAVETLGVGNNDNAEGITRTDAPDASQKGDVWVDGKVSIGSTSQTNALNVAGSVSIGENYAGIAAPENGMIIEGDVSVGQLLPNADMDVSNSARFDPASFSGLKYDRSNPEGTLYYDSGEDLLKYHDGTEWKPLGADDVSLGSVVEVLTDFIGYGWGRPASHPEAKARCPTKDNSDYDYVVTGYKFYTDNDCPDSCRTTLPEIHRIGIICTALE